MVLARQLALADSAQAGDVVVVVDVLRAFSAEAVAFDRGAPEIIAVGSVEEALAWKQRDPQALVMGEVNGYRVDGFDLWNSPTELLSRKLSGRRLVHRTTAGTQGILGCAHSKVVLAASFLVASATAHYLRALHAEQVDFVITGRSLHRDGNEDAACADYIMALLNRPVGDPPPDATPFLQAARKSDAGQRFLHEEPAAAWLADLEYCLQPDRYDFAMRVSREPEGFIVRPVRAVE